MTLHFKSNISRWSAIQLLVFVVSASKSAHCRAWPGPAGDRTRCFGPRVLSLQLRLRSAVSGPREPLDRPRRVRVTILPLPTRIRLPSQPEKVHIAANDPPFPNAPTGPPKLRPFAVLLPIGTPLADYPTCRPKPRRRRKHRFRLLPPPRPAPRPIPAAQRRPGRDQTGDSLFTYCALAV